MHRRLSVSQLNSAPPIQEGEDEAEDDGVHHRPCHAVIEHESERDKQGGDERSDGRRRVPTWSQDNRFRIGTA